jgi:two-component system chemotaxis response regulator CheB
VENHVDKNREHGDIPSPIRVLVADDSIIVRSALARMLKDSPHIQLCGFAANGGDTVASAKLLKPDVITLDVLMPVLDGMGALRQIMREWPCPVIMVSCLTSHGAEVTLEALSAGAFDYVLKEDLFRPGSGAKQLLIDRIEAAARSSCHPTQAKSSQNHRMPGWLGSMPVPGRAGSVPPGIIAIGASTGGPKAIENILTALPGELPVPVVVVQHLPRGFTGCLCSAIGQPLQTEGSRGPPGRAASTRAGLCRAGRTTHDGI